MRLSNQYVVLMTRPRASKMLDSSSVTVSSLGDSKRVIYSEPHPSPL